MQKIELYLYTSEAIGVICNLSGSGVFIDILMNSNRSAAGAGQPFNVTVAVEYYLMLAVFDQLQLAGPHLDPQTMGAAMAHMPSLGGTADVEGTWSYANGHSLLQDGRLVCYAGLEQSPNTGKNGTYVPLGENRWYGLGGWPTEKPVFPPACLKKTGS